jgi:RNA polymerase primary sigma factor
MPLDPLEHPLGVLTDHPVLDAETEAALITTLRSGVEARVAIHSGSAPIDQLLLHRIALGDEARATLARHNLRLVVSIAKRYRRVAGPHLTLEDLVSFGAIGLLQGIDKFDPAKSGKLSTYVTWWIRQAVGRGIAEESRVIDLPVHMHERLSQYHKARSRLAQQLSREPTTDEVAVTLGWRPRQVTQLEAVTQETLSLNAKARETNDRTELGDMVPDQRFDPEASALDTTLRDDLSAAMAHLLTEREQRFLRAYFGFDSGEKATLEQVGASEGLTRERVRQVIAGALAKLRDDRTLRGYAESGEASSADREGE